MAQFEPLPTPRMVGLANSQGNKWKVDNAIPWNDFKKQSKKHFATSSGNKQAVTEVAKAWKRERT